MMQLEINDELDREFLNLVLEIEKRYEHLSKQDRLKIESWVKKLCIVTYNKEWKKNRNLHAIVIIDNILNNKLTEPYNKFANDHQVPLLSKTLVKSQISDKFLEISLNGYENNLEDFSSKILNQQFYRKINIDDVTLLRQAKQLYKER
jgi:uncharacterized protein YpbB